MTTSVSVVAASAENEIYQSAVGIKPERHCENKSTESQIER
jgi:hypothetical protein